MDFCGGRGDILLVLLAGASFLAIEQVWVIGGIKTMLQECMHVGRRHQRGAQELFFVCLVFVLGLYK